MALNKVTLRTAIAADFSVIRELAHDIWWPTYGGYLPHGQISLMLDLIYSEHALRSQFEAGQRFILAERAYVAVGFVGFQPKPDMPETMRIEKLYVQPPEQGKGTGKLLISRVSQAALAAGCSHMELNVNRNNSAAEFYRQQGFVIADRVDTPYHGYTLNDYVMRKELGSNGKDAPW